MNVKMNAHNYGVKTKSELSLIYNDFAPSYHYELFINDHIFGLKKLRRWLLDNADGKILDVACGTGENFPLYKNNLEITAIDLSPGMLEIAGRRAEKLELNIDLRIMDAESLLFPDRSFDTVVSAMSTCTFPEPIQALHEIKRVCRRDGRILLLEHGLSSWELFGRYQDRSAQSHFMRSGCRWNQEPIKMIRSAGLRIISHKSRMAGVFHAFICTP